jgi:spermidine synthase
MGAEPSALWHWALAFFIPLLALLPATLAMGATLPAMERLLRRNDTHPLGSVYAANTAGAMTGLLLAVFFFSAESGAARHQSGVCSSQCDLRFTGVANLGRTLPS